MILSAVLEETARLIGVYIDKVRALDDHTLLLRTRIGDLLVSADPRAPRFYLAGRSEKSVEPEGFFRLVKDRLESGRIEAIEQIGFDRRFKVIAKGHELVVDLMGTRANMTLFGPTGAAGRLRKIAGSPPQSPRSLAEALTEGVGLSKVLKSEAALRADLLGLKVDPVYYPGSGAYPFALRSVDAKPMPMASMSQALEQHYVEWLPKLDAEATVRTVRGQLELAQRARVKSLEQIGEVLDTAARSRQLQMYGELILAFSPKGVTEFEAEDYDGNAVTISLNSSKTPVENAERYFTKARKAKNAATGLAVKAEQTKSELQLISRWLQLLEGDPVTIAEDARKSGMLREQAPPEKREVRHEGFRVRETNIEGYTVFWGENATSNDYVTTRLAKPNDFWLHVRGAHGSHVVLKTDNKPDRVPQSAVLSAARIAAKNSNQKHATHVPVTLTLAKYVRKPRKSAPGAVTFTNDKTLFVDP